MEKIINETTESLAEQIAAAENKLRIALIDLQESGDEEFMRQWRSDVDKRLEEGRKRVQKQQDEFVLPEEFKIKNLLGR